jgi:hypothetical protein
MNKKWERSIGETIVLSLEFKSINNCKKKHWKYQYFKCAFPRFRQHTLQVFSVF